MAQDPLYLLCIEPHFPGRLGSVADWLVRKRGYRCQFYCRSADPPEHWPPSVGKGMDVVRFEVGGAAREPGVHWRRLLERSLCYAQGCFEVLQARRPRPLDIVLGRSNGLGSTLFVPIFAPGVPVVNLFDYYYHAHAHDLAGEAGPQTPMEYFHWRRAANALELVDLENGVTPWVATRWQRDLFPPEYRDDFLVLFDGVDVRRVVHRTPGPRTVAGRAIPAGMRVVSFVARALERVRGFDRFLTLANRLVRACPEVLCVVAGGSPVTRGLDIEFFQKDYQAHALAQQPLADPERFWFLGSVAPPVVAELLSASDLHLYPSRPFPVSRSLVQAMAAGCVVLGWDHEPVREFLTHGVNGLLAPADDLDALERQALTVLKDLSGHRPLGEAAAETVRRHYAQDVTLPGLAGLFDRLLEGKG
ncbi:MAG: glycosyltransferase [Planctomycetes bacterium]|nr:glycosyltransferase [Planctomycetota bacterium]